ncbi:ATP-binding protein [Saccharibacillus sacchari]|uniref:ATP-binding protein n=1 Tax=Saccharibacillus sacchari TaxID=456493 RepID=UPI0005639AE0|nr:ATP-binding protein [Saccharibacillus sacchari]
MNIRGIILEGYSNSGKTSLLRAIKQYQAQDETSESSVVILGEHYSQILNNVHGKLVQLSQEQHIDLLRNRVDMIKQLNDWANFLGPGRRKSRGLFFVLERFHLNHRVAFSESNPIEITELEKQLYELGAKCMLLTISNDKAEERIKSRNSEDWLNKSKESIEQACKDLIETQNILRIQAAKSVVPTTEMNTDHKNWDEYARLIMEDHDFA